MANGSLEQLNIGKPGIGEVDAEARLSRDRTDIEALCAKADHRLRAGDHRAAASFYSAVVGASQALGTPSVAFARLAGHATQMLALLTRTFRDHILSTLDSAGYPAVSRPPRFQEALEMLLGERPRPSTGVEYPQLPKLFYYPGLPHIDFADPSIFPWRSALEGCFSAMRDEAESILAESDAFSPYVTKIAHRPQADSHGLLENPDWSSYYLWANGKPVDEHAARCPSIFHGLTDNVPLFDVAGRSPSAYLSLLRPGAHIPPHTGMLNCRYICHLPLIVPDHCQLRVGRRVAEWQEGKLLAFDDTIEHEAWNRGKRNRLILLFEVWSPDLSEIEKALIRLLLEAVDSYR